MTISKPRLRRVIFTHRDDNVSYITALREPPACRVAGHSWPSGLTLDQYASADNPEESCGYCGLTRRQV